MNVKVQLLEGATLPSYQTSGAAGMDLHAFVENEVMIDPFQRALIRTGIKVEIPEGYELQIRPRSGLAYKNGITVLNTPGTIDSDFRGEIGVILINLGNEPFIVKKGERIAQAVLKKVEKVEFIEVDFIGETERGSGGFGHTGRK